MFTTKPKYSEAQTPEQRAAMRRQMRLHDDATRKHCNWLMFWRICEKPQCRRGRTCSHDMHACFKRHWVLMPEDEKEWIRGALKAKVRGENGVEALGRAADLERENYFKRMKIDEAPGGESAPADAAAAPDADVRIRRV